MEHDPGVWLMVRLDRKFQSSLEPKYPRVDTVEGGGSMPCNVGIARQGFLWFVLRCIFICGYQYSGQSHHSFIASKQHFV